MTLNGVMALILRYFTEFGSFRGALRKAVEDVVVKSSRSLSHLLMSFLLRYKVLFLWKDNNDETESVPFNYHISGTRLAYIHDKTLQHQLHQSLHNAINNRYNSCFIQLFSLSIRQRKNLFLSKQKSYKQLHKQGQ